MARLLNFFRRRRDRLEQDLDRELRYHVDRRVEEMIADGLSEPEARRRASIELGGVLQVKDAVRDTWIWATTLRTLLHDANPTVPVRFETMDELFAGALAYPRFRTQVIGVFAAAAALLAAVGIFSVLAYLVGQRTRELAVRRAVGAQAGDVIRLVVGQGLRLAAIGLVLGLAGALAVARLLEGFLYAISPWDVGTYLMAIGVLGVTALLATLLPAIRAATVAPLIALQQE